MILSKSWPARRLRRRRRTAHNGRLRNGEERGEVLWRLDKESKIRFSHENPDVQALYAEYLEKPLGHRSHQLLHTDHSAWDMPNKV